MIPGSLRHARQNKGINGVAIAGSGYWWFTMNNVDADKEMTAQMNQPTHPPKDFKPKPAGAPAAATTSGQTNGQ